jgi:hypothetical protein
MVKHLLTTTAATLALASAGLAQQATPPAPVQTREQPAQAQQQEGQAGQQEPGPVVIQGEHGQTQTSAPEVVQGQQGQPGATTSSGTEVTGVVTSADEQTHEIVIDGQTYLMPEEGGGAALMPAEGDEVTLFYEEQGGRKVITRIGQPRQ